MRARVASLFVVIVFCGCGADTSHRVDPLPIAGGRSGASGAAGESGAAGGAGDMQTEPEPNTGGGSGEGGAGPEPGDGDGDGDGDDPKTFDELVGTAEGRNDVPAGEVCERIATIQCAGEATCCAAPGRDFEGCKATMKQGCIRDLYLDAVTADAMTGYDQQAARAMFTEYEDRARRCDLSVAEWGASMSGLRTMTRGTIAQGAACQPMGLDLISPGAKAAAFLFACEGFETHACFPRVATWTCAPREPEGGACFMDMNCVDGLYCTNSKALSLQGGTCRARKPDGEPCDLLTDCASTACKGGTCVERTKDNIFCLQ